MSTITVIQEVKTALEEAGLNHAKIYLAICRGMKDINPSFPVLSKKIGKAPFWANQYRYMVELTDRTFSALYEEKISPSTANALAGLVDGDQEACLEHILSHGLKKKFATAFVENRFNEAQTRREKQTLRMRPWPTKKLVSLNGNHSEPHAVPTKAPVSPKEEASSSNLKEVRRDWLENTGNLREHGSLPPDLAKALYGGTTFEHEDFQTGGNGHTKKEEVVTVSRPIPIITISMEPSSNGKTDGGKAEKVFRPHVVGNELIVAGILWIITAILRLLEKFNSIPAPRLAAAMLDPVDELRFRNLMRQVGDQVELAEGLLTLASRHRGL